MANAYFVTGTDTAVGKTLLAAGLLSAAANRGLTTLGLKPVAAGCVSIDGQWMNDDARELQQLSNINPDYDTVNPVALHDPMAPHIAAMQEGTTLDASKLAEHCRSLLPAADFVVIEGAGGWQVPLNDTQTMADLALSVNCPVILIVGMRLGCINHALLTAAAIKQQGLPLAGWIANHVDPAMAAQEENVVTLQTRLPAPLIGRVPFMDRPDAASAACHIRLEALL